MLTNTSCWTKRKHWSTAIVRTKSYSCKHGDCTQLEHNPLCVIPRQYKVAVNSPPKSPPAYILRICTFGTRQHTDGQRVDGDISEQRIKKASLSCNGAIYYQTQKHCSPSKNARKYTKTNTIPSVELHLVKRQWMYESS